MQFVIQTGGKGSRLKKITKGEAKPLVRINNKRLIDIQIANLKKYKFNKIIILNNEKYQSLEVYLKKKYGNIFQFFNEKKPLGTGGALKFLKDIKKKTFIMIYGDLVFDFNFKKLLNFHNKNNSDLTLVAHPNSHPHDSDIIVANKHNKIINFYKKPHIKKNIGNLCLAGICVFNKKILKDIKNNKFQDFSKNIISKLIKKKHKICAYRTREYIKDAGTIERIKDIKQDMKNKKLSKLNIQKKMPAIFLDKDGVLNQELYNKKYQNIKFILPNIEKTIKKINDKNFLSVVVTNQPAIAKGFVKESKVLEDFRYLETYLGFRGAYLDKIYYCPCHPEKGFKGEIKKYKRNCNWRKPNNGMIKKAERDLNINLSKSLMIGDRFEDYMAAKKSNLKFYFVGNYCKIKNVKNFKNLNSAVTYFFSKTKK